jgi:hypothetical protein
MVCANGLSHEHQVAQLHTAGTIEGGMEKYDSSKQNQPNQVAQQHTACHNGCAPASEVVANSAFTPIYSIIILPSRPKLIQLQAIKKTHPTTSHQKN